MDDISHDGIRGAMIITVNIPKFPITLSTSIESKITIDNREKAMPSNTAMNAATPIGIAHFLLSWEQAISLSFTLSIAIHKINRSVMRKNKAISVCPGTFITLDCIYRKKTEY